MTAKWGFLFNLTLGLLLLGDYPYATSWHRPFELCLGVLLVVTGLIDFDNDNRL